MCFKGKKIVLGVTGSIAAYKTGELIRLLREHDAEVKVILTEAGKQFVTPSTLQALSENPVLIDLFDLPSEAAMSHIQLAKWANLVLIAPASAHCIAKLNHGFADDLLSTVCLATFAPIFVAPAMNKNMWKNANTQKNIRGLKETGCRIIGPAVGEQACGDVGPGRMVEPQEIVDYLVGSKTEQLLMDCEVVITAGPTREPIDPVRYISNHSSGKMGYAIAAAASSMGAKVTLISGPVSIPPPSGITVELVETSEEMFDRVMGSVEKADILIGCAAVADFRPESYSHEKIKKSNNVSEIQVTKTRDILLSVSRLKNKPFIVGFAAETTHLRSNALKKMKEKSLDVIASNDVSNPDIGFNSLYNEMLVCWPGGEKMLAQAPKNLLSVDLIKIIAKRYHEKNSIKET